VRRASAAAMQLELDLPIFRPGLRPRVGLKRARPCGRRRWDVRIRAATFERGCCQGCCPAGRLRRIELLSSIGSARRVASQIRVCALGCRAKSLTNVPAPAWEGCQRPPEWVSCWARTPLRVAAVLSCGAPVARRTHGIPSDVAQPRGMSASWNVGHCRWLVVWSVHGVDGAPNGRHGPDGQMNCWSHSSRRVAFSVDKGDI
jgi:hypothetical protein